ncbi:glycosyltransferase family 4 protein [Oscillatoriales cyanobacterium LEGE 11467]|uniref:Glycosyltransferase family 4 protein n=1 Tax=Zarconia navalis LEGE 11467 TaxID=1828826 RepID=A0A928Z5U7_9CYAN|nr:glycosyltransferase family 4 protein [Zarconia navalis]MBE9039682.1 glycosyltransferase family 4 protein [Zarconia navalis LEGE 11467]
MKFQHHRSTPKVSILVSDLSKSGAGRWGGAVRTFLLARSIQNLGYEVEILGFIFGDEPPDSIPKDLPFKTVPGKNYPGFLASATQLLSQIEGDILYALRPKPTTFGLALLKKMQTQCRVILDIDDWELSWHGGDDWKYQPSLKQFARDILKPNGALRYPDAPFYLKRMESMVSRADEITVHTEFLQKRFGGVYVPNGKDTSLFEPEKYDRETSKKKYGLSGYRILMFPGAPRPYKGVEDVLVALDRLAWPDLRLAIVGGSPYDDYDRQLLSRWGRWIVKLPTCPVEQMPEVVAAADIIVVPQRDVPAARAQFPLKLTDAMAMAKPILATRVGDIPTIIEDGGFLVDPSSPEQIAEQIQWIFEHLEDARERGSKARERCVEHYSINAMSEKLAPLLQSSKVSKLR